MRVVDRARVAVTEADRLFYKLRLSPRLPFTTSVSPARGSEPNGLPGQACREYDGLIDSTGVSFSRQRDTLVGFAGTRGREQEAIMLLRCLLGLVPPMVLAFCNGLSCASASAEERPGRRLYFQFVSISWEGVPHTHTLDVECPAEPPLDVSCAETMALSQEQCRNLRRFTHNQWEAQCADLLEKAPVRNSTAHESHGHCLPIDGAFRLFHKGVPKGPGAIPLYEPRPGLVEDLADIVTGE